MKRGPDSGAGIRKKYGHLLRGSFMQHSSIYDLSRGWEGKKSAWLAVIGFIIIMFNLIAVNLVLAGLHSYA